MSWLAMNRAKLGLVVGLVLLTLSGLSWVGENWRPKTDDEDLRVGVLTDSGLAMINVSPARRMINVLEVAGDRDVWIPGGLGWYKSDRVKKLLTLENKTDLVAKVFLLNFGFETNNYLWKESADPELNSRALVEYWGISGLLKYRMNGGNWLMKRETVTDQQGDDVLDGIMPRDMAETRVVNLSSEVTVVNTTNNNGMANFVATAIQRAGLNVVNVLTEDQPLDAKCQIRSAEEGGDKATIDELSKMFPECEKLSDRQVVKGETEIYFGQSWAEMINYQSFISK